MCEPMKIYAVKVSRREGNHRRVSTKEGRRECIRNVLDFTNNGLVRAVSAWEPWRRNGIGRKYLVVAEGKDKERTCKVKWLKTAIEKNS